MIRQKNRFTSPYLLLFSLSVFSGSKEVPVRLDAHIGMGCPYPWTDVSDLFMFSSFIDIDGRALLKKVDIEGIKQNIMSNYSGGEDAYLYSASAFMKTGGRLSAKSAISDLLKALEYYDNPLIKSDAFVTMGCAYDRLGNLEKGRDMFEKSKNMYSKFRGDVNKRAYKALAGGM